MLGRAGEIKITDALHSSVTVREWMKDHPNHIVLDVVATTGGEGPDYFYIFYKVPSGEGEEE
ncbi:hypothetical protein [Paenibacillus alkalitolerans]|uniref:hypothetical protein n=1 Tax=Paenibacillus alkalitolerans TaxID=2799335 RepID=UPI0018F3F7AC|nr:hypothetical protein [Paenibacillus alkalitolerans]